MWTALIGTGVNSSGGQGALALKLTAELDRGVPRATVVLHLLRSEASRIDEVDVTYEELLGSSPHAGPVADRSGAGRA